MPESPTNRELADLFERLAELCEVAGANRFKVIAYQKVSRVLRDLEPAASGLSRGELTKLDGVGTGAADRIREFVDTGAIAEYDELAAEIPAGVLDVMRIPGVGPKSASAFWKQAGVTDLDTLAAKLDTGELAELKGFGPKKLDNIRKGMAFAAQAAERKRISTAWTLATTLIADLADLPGVERIEPAGSLRRGRETVGDVDLLVAMPADADRAPVFDAFTGHELATEVLLRGETKASIRTTADMQADLRIISPDQFGAALMYFTGSKEHNVKMRERAIERGMSLNEYALTEKASGDVVASATEAEVFAALGLPWIPPELREDRGEFDRAATGELPELIELGDIVAELHAHTTASDGQWTIRELALAAAARGCHTIAVTDHSKGQVQANGLDEARLATHIEAVQAVAEELAGTIRVLAGSEVDILTDGRLDYSDELLDRLELVVASPHASLQQDPETATARLLRAIDSGKIHILGHPTGRLVLRREGMSPDIRALAKAAAAAGVALEINANAYRLDLRDTHARIALEEGCRLSINTDAHGPGNFEHLRFGVATARRAGATAADVINTWSPAELDGFRERSN